MNRNLPQHANCPWKLWIGAPYRKLLFRQFGSVGFFCSECNRNVFRWRDSCLVKRWTKNRCSNLQRSMGWKKETWRISYTGESIWRAARGWSASCLEDGSKRGGSKEHASARKIQGDHSRYTYRSCFARYVPSGRMRAEGCAQGKSYSGDHRAEFRG